MNTIVLLAAPFLAGLQDPLNQLAATSTANHGVQSAVSADEDVLFHARGPRVYEVDADAVRANELGSPTCPADHSGTWYDVEASVTALLDADPYLWIGGGDEGLYRIDRSQMTPTVDTVDANTGGRWIFDLAEDPATGAVYAVFGALADSSSSVQSQLRVYRGTTGALLFTADLPTSVAGTACSVVINPALANSAYVAMGRAGVVRVDISGTTATVTQGPGPASLGVPSGEENANRFRDLALADGFLYVAADDLGLLAIDLSGTWAGTGMTVETHTTQIDATYEHDPVRVDAEVDAGTGDVIVAVGAAVEPSLAHEWGNYVQYGNFEWNLGPLGIDDPGKPLTKNALFVFARGGTGVLNEVGAVETLGGSHALNTWKSLDLHHEDGRWWVYDEAFSVHSFEYPQTGAFVIQGSDDCYFPEPAEDHSLSIPTQLEPNVLLTSHDGQSTGHYAITGSAAVPSLVGITGAFDYPEDYVGLLVQKTWLASASATVEWALCPTSKQSDDDFFEVLEFAPNTSNPAAAFTTWNKWYLEVADDPCAGGGRGYRTVAVAFDPASGTDLLAVSRTGIPNGVALYRAGRIMNAAKDPGTALGSELAVNPLGHLLTHEGSTDPPFPARRSTFFEWDDGQDDRLALVIAAGVQKCTDPPTCTNATHAKLVFFDLEDCRSGCATPPSPCCPVATDPSTCLPGDDSLRRVALSSVPESNAFGVTVGEIDGTQFAFSAETSGAVGAWDLTNLFASTAQPPLAEAGRWNMADSVLDGAPVPCTDVVFRAEEDAQGSPIHVLYVAANRRGVVRLQVIDNGPTGNPRVDFVELETINTPGQPSGLSLANPVLSGAPVPGLIVADHGGNGIKLYVAE